MTTTAMPTVRQSPLATVLKKLSPTGVNYVHWPIITWGKPLRLPQYVVLFPVRKQNLMSLLYPCFRNRSQVVGAAVAAKPGL